MLAFWKFPGTVPIWLLCFGAGAAGEVVSSTCTFGRQAFEPIAPEFLTCTTSALLGERIGWRGHDAAASQTRLLISGSVLTSRVSKAGGAEMAPEGIWHSGWPRARAWHNAYESASDEFRVYFHLQLPRVTFFEELG